MYYPDTISNIKPSSGSPSLLCNNLSSSFHLTQAKSESLCFIRLREVYITHLTGESVKVPIAKSTIYQACFINLQGKCVLAVASNLGIQIWSMYGDHMIFYFPLDSLTTATGGGLQDSDDDKFMRGVTTFLNYLCVGCSSGNILIFNCKDQESSNFPLISNIETTNQRIPITSLASTSSTLICGNDIGKIIGFTCTTTTTTDIVMRSQTLLSNNNNVIFDNQFSFDGYGSPCTSLICTEYLICAAYATGHLRLFRFDIKELIFEISAHTRMITGMALNSTCTELAVCSQDQYLNVWSLPDFSGRENSQISLIFSQCIENKMCTGVTYLRHSDCICVSFYDEEELHIFRKIK